MESDFERRGVREAIEDVHCRTLAGVRGDIGKLIYLASTRDYNTGRYYHDGLAFRFTADVAEQALEFSHRTIFERLVVSSLEAFTQEVEIFLRGTHESPEKVIGIWRKLEPYRVTIPQNSDIVSVELFLSNVRMALAILESRLSKPLPQFQQAASPPQ